MITWQNNYNMNINKYKYQFSSVAQSCPTLCNPMDCSPPGFPVLIHPEFAQTNVYWVYMPSNHLIYCPLLLLLPWVFSFPASGSFPMNWLFASGGQSFGASASAEVLPMNIQGWFPLGLIGLISLQSKGLSRVFSSTTIQKHQFFSSQPSLWYSSHIHTWLLAKPKFWLCRPLLAVMSLVLICCLGL